MSACSPTSDCSTCSGRFVCRCLQVTETMLLEAIELGDLRTLKEIRAHTGAGDGCTACHRRLHQFLERRIELQMTHASSSA